MFGLFKKDTDKKNKAVDKEAEEFGAKIANSFLETLQKGKYAIPVISFKQEEAKKFSERSIESQLSGLTPEELSLLFEMLNFQIERMEKAIKVYDKFQENMLKLAKEASDKKAMPKEVGEKMINTVSNDTDLRRETYNSLLKLRAKIKPMRDMIIAYIDAPKKVELE